MTIQYVRSKQLLEAELGDDIVALDASGGQCYGFNSVSAQIWQLLANPMDFDTLRRIMLEQYDVDEKECTADLLEHLADLEREGLIRKIDLSGT